MLPYIVHKRMPYIVHKRMPYIVHKKRMSYVPVHKRMSLEEDNLGSVSLVVELEEVKLIYRGSPTYTKITNTVSTNTFFGLCTCKWGN